MLPAEIKEKTTYKGKLANGIEVYRLAKWIEKVDYEDGEESDFFVHYPNSVSKRELEEIQQGKRNWGKTIFASELANFASWAQKKVG